MAPAPNGGQSSHSHIFNTGKNARPGGSGFSASRLPPAPPIPQGQQRSFSPLGNGGRGQSPQYGGPSPPAFPTQPPPRQGSSGSPHPYPNGPPNGNGARRPSGGGPPISRLANAPHNSLAMPSSFAGGAVPAPSAGLKERILTLPSLLYKVHKNQERIEADAEWFEMPLLPSDEADDVRMLFRDKRAKARAAAERELNMEKENLVDMVVGALGEFAGKKVEELVARGELTEAASPAELVAKLSRLEVEVADRLTKMQEELEERIEEIEEKWKVELEKLQKAGPPPVAVQGGTLAQAGSVSKADFDALTAKFDRLAALVGDATPPPPASALSDTSPASASAAPSGALSTSTVLGKRTFSADAAEPSSSSASPPSSSSPQPTLFARVAAVDTRVAKIETAVSANAEKDEKTLSELQACTKEVREIQEWKQAAEERFGKSSARGGEQMVIDESEEAKAEKIRKTVTEAVEKVDELEERLSEVQEEWTRKLDRADSRILTLSNDVGALQKIPVNAVTPTDPSAAPAKLRIDLDTLTRSVDTLSARCASLPSSIQVAILNSLSSYIHNDMRTKGIDPGAEEGVVAAALRVRVLEWDKAVHDVAAQEEKLKVLPLLEATSAKLQKSFKSHKKKTDERFVSMKDLIDYFETALPEFDCVATIIRKLQSAGHLPSDEALGLPLPPVKEDTEPGTAPQAQLEQQKQQQANGDVAVQAPPRTTVAAQAPQGPPQQQQQVPPVVPPQQPEQMRTNGFADGGEDEEDELDEDNMLVAPEAEGEIEAEEDDDPMIGGDRVETNPFDHARW
ncbi:hypothetical protein JCM11251_005257 [Rhodosporidiobolus azoricus]